MSKFIPILLITLLLPLYGQPFMDYTYETYRKIYPSQSKFYEINADITKIGQSQSVAWDRAELIMTYNLAKEILLTGVYCADIIFAQQALVVSNGTDIAIKIILGRIDDRLNKLKEQKKYISNDLGYSSNNQIIYLGNDARKEIDKVISQVEEWLEEARKL